MVLTGYFAQVKKYKEKNLSLINIALVKPDWFKESIENYPDLYPTKEILYEFNYSGNVDNYIESYSGILAKLNPEKVYRDLDNKIILCYEKPTDFCHRHLVAIWLNQNGFECREFNVSNYLRQPVWGYSFK